MNQGQMDFAAEAQAQAVAGVVAGGISGKNRLNSCGSSFGGMPGPVLVTEMRASSPMTTTSAAINASMRMFCAEEKSSASLHVFRASALRSTGSRMEAALPVLIVAAVPKGRSGVSLSGGNRGQACSDRQRAGRTAKGTGA